MINDAKCIQMILEFGGLENAQYLDPSNRETRLKEILDDARVRLDFSRLTPTLIGHNTGQANVHKRGASPWNKNPKRPREAALNTGKLRGTLFTMVHRVSRSEYVSKNPFTEYQN